MSFLFPAAFFFAALAPVIIVLYLRRPRRVSQDVSTLLFWQRVLEREPRRKFFGRLRHPLSLLLQLLILLLLILALAQPQWGESRLQTHTVVVLDLRARLHAAFPAALREALLAVSTAGPHAEVAILGLEQTTKLIAPFSADAKDLRQRLETLTPSDAGGDPVETLQLAERLLESRRGQKRLVWISDRPAGRPGWEERLVGRPQDNAALLSLAQRPLPNSPQSAAIFLQAANFSGTNQSAEVELALDEKIFDLRRLDLPAGGTAVFSTVLPSEVLQGTTGRLTARLLAPDALAFDDTVHAVLPAAEKPRILLITKNNPFLEFALKADPGLSIDILDPAAWRSGLGAGFDTVIFDHWLPEQATLSSLGAGRFWFYGRSPFDGDGESLPGVPLEDVDTKNPLFWKVDLKSVRLYHANQLTPPTDEEWRVGIPARSDGEPLILTLENPAGTRHLATAFGVEESNLALRAAFPLFVGNAVRWLANRDTAPRPTFAAGGVFQPADGEKIIDQSGTARESSVRLRQNGFYALETEKGNRWLAVNTLAPSESDLRKAQFSAGITSLSGSWPVLRLWQWLALAALLLILLEWWWHHRRLTE